MKQIERLEKLANWRLEKQIVDRILKGDTLEEAEKRIYKKGDED
jgi:hypothetical protein